MRRKRFQRGSLQKRKHGRRRVWVACWWEDGSRPSKVLGQCSEISRGAAEAMLADILRPLNDRLARNVSPACSFGKFVTDVYLPHCRRTWKESTAGTSEQVVRSHLLPAFGGVLLHNIRRDELQDFLESKAANSSASVVAHLRWFLNAIFKLAVSDGLVSANPAAQLRIPRKCKPGRGVRPLTEGEVDVYLANLNIRESVIARLAIFEGMRPGEILALRRSDVQHDTFRVERRVYRQKFDSPKNGKRREGAVSAGTLSLLQRWFELATSPDSERLLFPSEAGSTPISLDNLWRRSMKPRLEKVGLGWATFQILRKTNATLSKKAGVDPKVAADQRGHGVGVSLEVYTSSDMPQKREAVRKLEAAVRPKPETPIGEIEDKVA